MFKTGYHHQSHLCRRAGPLAALAVVAVDVCFVAALAVLADSFAAVVAVVFAAVFVPAVVPVEHNLPDCLGLGCRF